MKNLFTIRNRSGVLNKYCLLIGLIISFTCVKGQGNLITGTVRGDGETLPGVTVQVKGSNAGTITDIDGGFSINASSDDVLVFSFLGFITEEVTVGNQSRIDVSLDPDVKSLEEVVVIGYGTQKKKEVTGAVARVSGDEISKLITSDVGNALQGQIAGVNVVASGAPGSTSSILIRGVTSITGDNTPLFVVDGVPQDGDPRLSSNEIESIDVLKDAASASIYGTRGAAGVILITTKAGKESKPKVSMDMSLGVNQITSTVPLMNTLEEQYFLRNVDLYSTASVNNPVENNTDLLNNNNEVLDFVQNDNALTQTYNINVTGGVKSFSYNATFGYFDQEGVLINSFFKRFNGRVTTRYDHKKLSIRSSISYARENNERVDGNLLLRGLTYSPYQPFIAPGQVISDDQVGEAQVRAINFLNSLQRTDIRKRNRFNGNVDISYDLFKGMTLRSNFGGGVTDILDEGFNPPVFVQLADGTSEIDPSVRSNLEMRTIQQTNWAWTGMATYTREFGDHNLTGLVSFTYDQRTNEDFTARREGLVTRDLSVLSAGATDQQFAFSGANFVINTIGYIGRLQYNFKEKYLVSASLRRDGSSKFGPNNRYGTFPSMSLGWNVSDEAFWKPIERTFKVFKLRASYGTTGFEGFPAYSDQVGLVFGSDYNFGNSLAGGAIAREYANANIRWERSIATNFGVDLGFFNNKLTLTADVYQTDKSDMLFGLRVPPSNGVYQSVSQDVGSGNPNVTLNVGNMTNRGLEIALNYKLVKDDLTVNVGGTFSRNRNEVTKIADGVDKLFNQTGFTTFGDINSVVSVTTVGREIGSFFVHKTDGVIKSDVPNEELYGRNPETGEVYSELTLYQELVPSARLGDLKYVDSNNDSIIDTNDQVYGGSALPDFELGFNLNAEYKNFDFIMQWYASVGNEVINGSASYAYTVGRHQGLVDMWTPVNNESDLPIYRGAGRDHPNYSGTIDRWVEDGSFIRLRLVTLGYSLPMKMLKRSGIDKARVYVSSQNPLTITKYTGFDPEIGGSSILNKGFDRGGYPVSSQILFGLQMTF